jgi:hypothetical protein
VRASPPLDLVVLTLRNRGADVAEIARQVGLSQTEVSGALRRVTARFGADEAPDEGAVADRVLTR